METSIKITLIIVCAIVLSIGLATFGVYKIIHPYNDGKIISSNGVATIKAMPDLVSVYFNIETKGETSQEVNEENAEMVDELITALIKQGFERKQIITEGYSIYPEIEWINGRSVEKGHIANHNLRVELPADENSLIGKVIDAGADAGASISYINFELSPEKQNEYKAEALKQATEDAKLKAEGMAEGLGKRLGDLVSINSQDYNYSPWIKYQSASVGMDSIEEAKQVATSIQPGEEDITASVSVVFKLK